MTRDAFLSGSTTADGGEDSANGVAGTPDAVKGSTGGGDENEDDNSNECEGIDTGGRGGSEGSGGAKQKGVNNSVECNNLGCKTGIKGTSVTALCTDRVSMKTPRGPGTINAGAQRPRT